jgi:hypothetical protein
LGVAAYADSDGQSPVAKDYQLVIDVEPWPDHGRQHALSIQWISLRHHDSFPCGRKAGNTDQNGFSKKKKKGLS